MREKELEKKTKEVKSISEKIKKRETLIKVLKVALLVSLLFLIIIYFLLRLVYENGSFTISLDKDFARKSGIILYEKLAEKNDKIVLEADKLEFADNISINWIPKDIANEAEGSHNGSNYLAYTFYVENKGSRTTDYWYTIKVDDVIRDVDKAIRVMIYQNNEERVVYAKQTKDGNEEKNTEKFFADDIVLVKNREKFKAGDIDKYTVVIWVEGDDPDCVDYLIGGEMKMHMEIAEEFKKD